MRYGHLSLKALGNLCLLLTLAMSMDACSSGRERWKEEVQLSDGRVIVIERETIHKRGGDELASNRSGSKPSERHIRFNSLDGSAQTIEWRSEKESPQKWPEKPLVLDVVAGQPVIFSILAISAACEKYIKYVYRKGVWVEEELTETFPPRATNLLIRDGVDMPTFVNLEAKLKQNADASYRRALKQVGPSRQVCG